MLLQPPGGRFALQCCSSCCATALRVMHAHVACHNMDTVPMQCQHVRSGCTVSPAHHCRSAQNSTCCWYHALRHTYCTVFHVAADYNFDHPDAFDHNGLLQCLKDLKVQQWGQVLGSACVLGLGLLSCSVDPCSQQDQCD